MADRFVEKIRKRGWNIYSVSDHDNIDTFVPRGPEMGVRVGLQYVVFPVVSDPTSKKQILKSIDHMTMRGTHPKIVYDGQILPFACFRFQEEDVIVRGMQDYHLKHEDFYRSLDTLNTSSSPADN